MLISPTEYIDEPCEITAAVAFPSFLQRLNFNPEILVDVVSLTIGYNLVAWCSQTTCEIYKLSIDSTDARAKQTTSRRRRGWNFFIATEDVVVCLVFDDVFLKHSAIAEANLCLEDRNTVDLTWWGPVYEAQRRSLLSCCFYCCWLLFERSESGWLRIG